MIRTIKLKLDINPEGREKIFQTMRDYTEAFNQCAQWGFENHSSNKFDCHHATYKAIRERIPNFTSNLILSARDCACEALKATKCGTIPNRKPLGAMRYSQRAIHIYLETGYMTIATSGGRIKATFNLPKYYQKYSGWNIKSSNLLFRKCDNTFYVHCQVEGLTPEPMIEQSVLGIDRGIVNIAVCSDNSFYNSKKVKDVRAKYAHIRGELQSKGTRSAKRKLRIISGRERRFVTDINHCISKQIVQSNYTVFALEDLTNIRMQKRRGKEFNRKLNNWAFYELEQFIRYKAENIGKSVIFIDPKYTSQKCSKCGYIHKDNRNGPQFLCQNCGFELHADLNASRNIAQAGISGMSGLSVDKPNVAHLKKCSYKPDTLVKRG